MTPGSRPPDAFSAGETPTFEASARESLSDSQLRRNLGKATQTIRAKRADAVAEMPDWEELREAGRALKARVMRHLDTYLPQLEESVTRAGGTVHWARDAGEANRIITGIVKDKGAKEVVKVKSIATDETKLNEHLEAEGIEAFETDLAELIIQLAGETSSHILVPAIHKNRAEIRELFLRNLEGVDDLSDDPRALAEAARLYLRRKFLSARVGISGANFAVAETGTVCVVESEGNGRMCTDGPADARHPHGDREGHPDLAGLRGLYAAPAPLLDRRADEPLHLVLDRGFALPATARRSSTSS